MTRELKTRKKSVKSEEKRPGVVVQEKQDAKQETPSVEEGVYVTYFYLVSLETDRVVKGVGVFKQGVWGRVPEAIYNAFQGVAGWQTKVEKVRVKQ